MLARLLARPRMQYARHHTPPAPCGGVPPRGGGLEVAVWVPFPHMDAISSGRFLPPWRLLRSAFLRFFFRAFPKASLRSHFCWQSRRRRLCVARTPSSSQRPYMMCLDSWLPLVQPTLERVPTETRAAGAATCSRGIPVHARARAEAGTRARTGAAACSRAQARASPCQSMGSHARAWGSADFMYVYACSTHPSAPRSPHAPRRASRRRAPRPRAPRPRAPRPADASMWTILRGSISWCLGVLVSWCLGVLVRRLVAVRVGGRCQRPRPPRCRLW